MGGIFAYPRTLHHVHQSRRIRLFAEYENFATSGIYGYHFAVGCCRRPFLLLLGGTEMSIRASYLVYLLQKRKFFVSIEISNTWMAVSEDMAANQPHPPATSPISKDRKGVESQYELAQDG